MHQVSVDRAADRSSGEVEPQGHFVGDRGGRKRATRAADGRKMGDRYSQSMRAGEGGILLQTMGWQEFEGRWQVAGRRRVESVSYGVSDLRGLA